MQSFAFRLHFCPPINTCKKGHQQEGFGVSEKSTEQCIFSEPFFFYHGSYWQVLMEHINCTVPAQPTPASAGAAGQWLGGWYAASTPATGEAKQTTSLFSQRLHSMCDRRAFLLHPSFVHRLYPPRGTIFLLVSIFAPLNPTALPICSRFIRYCYYYNAF